MTQPSRKPPLRWPSFSKKNVGNFPDDLDQQVKACFGDSYGVSRKVFIALASMAVSDSCPPEARRLLMQWADEAVRLEDMRDPGDLAVRFARSVLEHQPGAEGASPDAGRVDKE